MVSLSPVSRHPMFYNSLEPIPAIESVGKLCRFVLSGMAYASIVSLFLAANHAGTLT